MELKLYQPLHDRWYKKAKHNAMQDPVYADIESRRQSDGPHQVFLSKDRNLGLEEWNTQSEILDRTPRPLLLRVLAWIHHGHSPKDYARRAKWFIQRGRRGYSDYDVWGFDVFLAQIIADATRQMRDNAHSYPARLDTFEEWVDIFNQIIEGMEAHKKIMDEVLAGDAYEVEKAKRTKAFELINKWFENYAL